MPTNKTVKEILRLLKRDKIIDLGEYMRIWGEYKQLHKTNRITNYKKVFDYK